MPFTDYQDKIADFFDAQMVSASPSTLIYWPNVEKPRLPGDGAAQAHPAKSRATAPWCRYSLVTTDNRDATPGFRDDFGMVAVQCFGPLGEGPGPVSDLAETVGAQFRRSAPATPREVVISGQDKVQFGSVSVREIGPDGEGWFQTNVLAQWSRKEAA